MSKLPLSEDTWLALFADEKAGMTRRELSVKYRVHPSTISRHAAERGLRKCDTGARTTAVSRREAGTPTASSRRAAPA